MKAKFLISNILFNMSIIEGMSDNDTFPSMMPTCDARFWDAKKINDIEVLTQVNEELNQVVDALIRN